MQACGFHRSEVPIVNAELPNPSSCFIVPLSIGQSLSSIPSQSAHFSRDSMERGKPAARMEGSEQPSGQGILIKKWTVLFVCFDVANLATICALALCACTFHRYVGRR